MTGVSAPLHPLEVPGAPRRRYQATLALQLLRQACLLVLVSSLLVPPLAGGPMAIAVGSVAVAAGVGATAQRRRAWSGLPAPSRRPSLPPRADQRYTAALSVLLVVWALHVCARGPAGELLAVLLGLGLLLDAGSSWARLNGHAPLPGRRVPTLVTAGSCCLTAAVVVGGLALHDLLSIAGLVGLLIVVALVLRSFGRSLRSAS